MGRIKTLISKAFISIITIYRWVVRPYLPTACRFTPSCSEYACQSIQQFGPGKGAYLSALRLLRCHPFSKGGIDHIPN